MFGMRRNILSTTTAVMALAGNVMAGSSDTMVISPIGGGRGDLHTIPRRRGSNSTEPHPATLSWQQRRKLAPGRNVMSRRVQNFCPRRA